MFKTTISISSEISDALNLLEHDVLAVAHQAINDIGKSAVERIQDNAARSYGWTSPRSGGRTTGNLLRSVGYVTKASGKFNLVNYNEVRRAINISMEDKGRFVNRRYQIRKYKGRLKQPNLVPNDDGSALTSKANKSALSSTALKAPEDEYTVLIFALAYYAEYVEFGTTRMMPKPFFSPVVDLLDERIDSSFAKRMAAYDVAASIGKHRAKTWTATEIRNRI